MKRVVLMFFTIVMGLSLLACTKKEKPAPEIPDAEIKGVVDVSIAVGDTFDRLAGISAKDHDGTDLTSKITVDGVVNANRADVYELTYTVIGKSEKAVSVSRKVTVVANATISGPELLPTAIEVGTPFDHKTGVTATDSDGTDLTSQLVITSEILNEAGVVDTSKEGVYTFTYSVTGISKRTVVVVIELTIYGLSDAKVFFAGTSQEEPSTYYLSAGFEIDLNLIATAKDYDNETLEIDAIEYDESLAIWVDNNVFKPTEPGTYTFNYKATGKNGNQSTTVLTIVVTKQGIEIDGVFVPVLNENVNHDGKPWNSTLIYTELKGKGEYGILLIVDAHGKVILVRDPYGTQYGLTTPIKQGTPEQVRGIPNNEGWTGADNFAGLLGPQGTEGGIPEGGFAIYFSRDNQTGSTHPIRTIGITLGREYGLYVKVVNLDIPNFNPPADDPRILGADDVVLYSNETFDPLAGVTGKDHDDSDLTVSVVFNNVDLTKPALGVTNHNEPGFADGYYAVVYEVTGKNGYQYHITRRVTVLPAVVDATIEGIDDVSFAIGQDFDPLEGVTAKDYDGTDLTSEITVEGSVDTSVSGTYTLTYKVTGRNNNEVIKTRTVTVTADAHFVIDPDMVTSIFVNQLYNPFTHITAKDHDGSDISSQITLTSSIYVDGAIDTSTAGTFDLVYSVTGVSGNEVSETITLEIKVIPNATITLPNGTAIDLTVGMSYNLLENVVAKDYDDSIIETIELAYDPLYAEAIVDNVFTPTLAGTYTFIYKVTGVNGVEVEVTLIITVVASGISINEFFIPLTSADIDRTGKPKNVITIYTTLEGMGEFGVLAIVDAHGRIVMTRDAFGEQIDVNNPIKAGNPTFPANLSGLPNFKTYDAYTDGLWTAWTKGGADVFEGLLGPQGTEGGIPEGGFAILFANGTYRATGLEHAREYGAEVKVHNLVIPNFDPTASNQDAKIIGADDIVLETNDDFDPMAGISGVDHNGDVLTVTIRFNNVDTTKPAIPDAPRVVNTAEGRQAYAQGYYSIVYSVTGANGYQVNVTRRVTVL